MAQSIAFIEITPDAGIELLCARAEELGAHVSRNAAEVLIHAGSATISARALAAGVELSVAAETPEDLQMIRNAIDGFAAEGGIAAPAWRNARPIAGKGRLIDAIFVKRQRISPSYYRIRLAGDFLAFARGGLHFRLLLGPEGAAWPEEGPEGIVWPGGIDAWHRPPYTVRQVSPAGEWLDFDVFLHQGGRVTEWCEEIAPGDRVMLTGPGGRGVKQARWMGIVGDETALPVILRAIEAAPPDATGEVAILIPHPADAQPVATPAGLVLRWVPRSEGKGILDLLAELSPPATDRFVFLAGERAEAEAARLWGQQAGLGTGEFLAANYWSADWVPPATQRRAKGLPLSPADAE